MTTTPPFDPPYKTVLTTGDSIRVVETLADGSTRILNSETEYVAIRSAERKTKQDHEDGNIPPSPTPRVQHKPGNHRVALYLEVPYSEKDNAKKAGAKWDATDRKWYVPHGVDVNNFKRWWPDTP